jgi:hypothetical protein
LTLGRLVAYYGDQTEFEFALNLNNHDLVSGLLMSETSWSPRIVMTESLKTLLIAKSLVCARYYASNGRDSLELFDLHRSFLLQNNCQEILAIPVQYEMFKNKLIKSEFEILIHNKKPITKSQIALFLACGRFHKIRDRAQAVWSLFSEDAQEYLCEFFPLFNLLHRTIHDPKFREAALDIVRKKDGSVALQALQKYGALSEIQVSLSAHWFFVDDFEKEIETEGYLGMFEIAVNAEKA